jgi:hypothetical protein
MMHCEVGAVQFPDSVSSHSRTPVALQKSLKACYNIRGHLSCILSGVQYGCLVVNAPTANTIAAAEHGIALIAALSRNVAQADRSVKEGKWERTKYVGVSLVNKVLAIIGFGKVGSRSPCDAGFCFSFWCVSFLLRCRWVW